MTSNQGTPLVAGREPMKLLDWENAAEAGTRFPPSKYKCPQCGENALEDNWPPNYFSASGSFGKDSEYMSGGNPKHVCLPCRIAFRVAVSHVTKGGQVVKNEARAYGITPLVDDGEYLLTPHDVWRMNYKKEHGEFPAETYG